MITTKAPEADVPTPLDLGSVAEQAALSVGRAAQLT